MKIKMSEEPDDFEGNWRGPVGGTTTTIKTEGLTGLMAECAAYRVEYTIFHDTLERLVKAMLSDNPTQSYQAFEHAREMLRRKPLC